MKCEAQYFFFHSEGQFLLVFIIFFASFEQEFHQNCNSGSILRTSVQL